MVEALHGKVAAEWLDRGIWLSRAAEELGDPALRREMQAAAERFAAAMDGERPEAFLLLSCPDRREVRARLDLIDLKAQAESTAALAETASATGNLDDSLRSPLFISAKQAWIDWLLARERLQDCLRINLQNGMLLAFGDPQRPGADPEWIPVRAWFYLQIDPGEANVVRGEGNTYWFVRVVNPSLAPHPRPIPNQRGPHGIKRHAAITAMIEAVRTNRVTPEQLCHMKQKELSRFYPDAGRTTLVAARNAALLELDRA